MTSLARPQGNLTGIALSEYSVVTKQVEILKEIAPSVARAGLMFNPDNPSAAFHQAQFEAAAAALGLSFSAFCPCAGLPTSNSQSTPSPARRGADLSFRRISRSSLNGSRHCCSREASCPSHLFRRGLYERGCACRVHGRSHGNVSTGSVTCGSASA